MFLYRKNIVMADFKGDSGGIFEGQNRPYTMHSTVLRGYTDWWYGDNLDGKRWYIRNSFKTS